MKKKTLIIILIVLFILSSFSLFFCEDRSYSMSHFHVNAILDQSGSMTVEEKITYDFSGSFNGVYRTLLTKGSGGIDDISVYLEANGERFPFEKNNLGQDNSYQILPENGGIQLKIFSHSQDESKTFVIKYKVLNVATKYQDIGELYWQFMGDQTEVEISDFVVNISIPQGAGLEDVKVFAHGPLSGNVKKVDAQNVQLSVAQLRPRQFVEARVLFPPSLISASQKVSSKAALKDILAEEQKWVDEANAKRARARALIGFSFVFALFQIFLIVFLYFKYDKEYKTSFDGSYYRELPGDYSPAVLAVLWNFGKATPKDITATLMDLVRRKYLLLKTEQLEVRGLLKKKTESVYRFELNPSSELNELKNHEKYLIDWLITTIGNGSSVTLKEIENSAKSRSEAMSFKSDYDAWSEYVKIEAEKYSFFDKSTLKGTLIGILGAVIGLIIGTYSIIAYENIAGFLVLIFTSISLIIYSALIKRRSQYGVEQYRKWKAFRSFLKDFSRMDKAQIPSVVMWEYYLVYAITLGVAEDVIKQLKLVFREEDFNNRGLTYMYYGAYGHAFNHFDSINHVTQTMVKTTESTYQHAISQMSSGSGGGGGFSGGGGGGGGGGGAGAF